MKLVLSRKGFDSSNGGIASPILPDGRLFSLPIPSDNDCVTFGHLRCAGVDVPQLVSDLGGPHERNIHLDPDLEASVVPREGRWRAAFGQSGAAQTHLGRQGVGAGDLFLFYGWFRQVEYVGGRYRFVPRAPDVHVIFGWLQVEDKPWSVSEWSAALTARYPALKQHPHLSNTNDHPTSGTGANTLYVATEHLSLGGHERLAGRGAGRFKTVSTQRTLTKPGLTRRHWRLPGWLKPRALSYHRSDAPWKPCDDHMELRSACIGQEFVLDCAAYPQAIGWAYGMIRDEAAV